MSSASSNAQRKSLFGYNRDDLFGQPTGTLVSGPRWQVDAASRRLLRRSPDPVGRSRSGAETIPASRRAPAKISSSHIDTGDVLWAQGGG